MVTGGGGPGLVSSVLTPPPRWVSGGLLMLAKPSSHETDPWLACVVSLAGCNPIMADANRL